MNQKEIEAAIAKAVSEAIASKDAQIAALKAASQRAMSYKVSEKGAVGVYGFGRFPVTLYASNMVRFLAEKDAILAFMQANASKLVWTKGSLAGQDAPAKIG